MENIVIIGAGLYGLYSALKISEIKKDAKIYVIELDSEAFGRATYINQARVHMGYHYPRSFSTAIKSAHYFDRFNESYDYCVNKKGSPKNSDCPFCGAAGGRTPVRS